MNRRNGSAEGERGGLVTVSVAFVPSDGTRSPGFLSDAELHFGDSAGPLAGLKLVGFGVWEAKKGGVYVTLPARAYGVGSRRQYFDLVRGADENHAHTAFIKAFIRTAWDKTEQGAAWRLAHPKAVSE